VDQKILNKVSRQVARDFPELAGATPTVRRQASRSGGGEQYLLTYKGSARLPGGKSLPRIVRVVVDPGGRILRISTSR
jgi:hypothetical protein